MSSFDTSHLPAGHRHGHQSREQSVYLRPKTSGKLSISIPDLRFEQSYLRSLQRFIHEAPEHAALKGDEKTGKRTNKTEKSIETVGTASGIEHVVPGLYGVPLKIDWIWVLYVTTRDQIFSPLAQGAILAVASFYLRPLLRHVGARIRTHVRQSWQSLFPPIEPHIQGGAGWMRKQLREFSVGGGGTNIALAK